MSAERLAKIREFRLRQSEEELLRKRVKAGRRAFFTQEDFDHAEVWATLFRRNILREQPDESLLS
jgi:hypothetical protein